MNLVLEQEVPPLCQDEDGTVQVSDSRVLLETVIRAFQDGASPESLVHSDSSFIRARLLSQKHPQ